MAYSVPEKAPGLWHLTYLLLFSLLFPFLRVGFWRNGFFADFYSWCTGFFRGFCRRIFSPHFCGEKVPKKSIRKIASKILQNLYNKNPRHISAEGPGQLFAWMEWMSEAFARDWQVNMWMAKASLLVVKKAREWRGNQWTPVNGEEWMVAAKNRYHLSTLRAQRLKKFSLAWNFQSRLKISILTLRIPHKE